MSMWWIPFYFLYFSSLHNCFLSFYFRFLFYILFVPFFKGFYLHFTCFFCYFCWLCLLLFLLPILLRCPLSLFVFDSSNALLEFNFYYTPILLSLAYFNSSRICGFIWGLITLLSIQNDYLLGDCRICANIVIHLFSAHYWK